MQRVPTVYIVDDDEAIRDSMQLLMKSAGLHAETYASAQAFLEAYDPARPGCLVVDVRMPGMSGLELQEHLNRRKFSLPVMVITGHGDIAMAVRAMKAGAVDFIEKPFDSTQLLERVKQYLDTHVSEREDEERRAEMVSRLDLLTPREQQVMNGLVAGKINKVIAADLGISCRTVEAHRANLMDKLGVRSLSDVIRIALAAESPQAAATTEAGTGGARQ